MSKLSDLAVKNAKPKAHRYELSDNGTGFRAIIFPSGRRSYATRLWYGGAQIKVTHGKAGALTLADARVLSAEAIKQARLGIDPRAAKKAAKIARQIATANSFAAIAELHLASNKVRKLRTVDQLRNSLERLVFPHLGDRPITEIKRLEVANALDHIEKHNGARSADSALSAISCVMNFYTTRDENFTSPLVKGMRRVDPKNPERPARKLEDDEIRKLWATGNRFMQFLLAVGCRRGEAAGITWKELTGNSWLLPAARNKVGLDLTRPLSALAMSVLGERGGDGEFIFSREPGKSKPLGSFSKIKKKLDKASGVTGWTWNDLRHTAKTLMSRARVPSDHSEQVLGHILPGLKGRYDHHDYIEERGRALETLAALIQSIVKPPGAGIPDINTEREKRQRRARS
jgi:integrase